MRTLTVVAGLLGFLAILTQARCAENTGLPPKSNPSIAAPVKPAATATNPSMKESLARLKIPPAWLAGVTVDWDVAKPWKDGRLEVRRLLALDDQDKVRQGVKITWLYARKGDIGDGHELPLYLFLSGNYDWALLEYPKYLQKVAGTGATHGYLCYASCFAHFGEYAKALEVLDKAMADLPKPPWRITSTANIWNRRGDIHVEMGDTTKAKPCYAEAMRLYPTSDQPGGRHLLARQAAKVQTKLDLLVLQSLRTARLRDGVYTGKSLGYSDAQDMLTTVTIKDGKIAHVQVRHQEKIDLGATKIIPKRIVDTQSLKVDTVTGATITSQAIVDGVFQALKQAGLQ
ncbi:MAG: FMN-binding protein [Planctomycetes bacterium]|nr:FMN-binding protein [Planctomycetota bacterium]